MKTVIVSRPNVGLPALRELGKLALNRDLTTNTKGASEPLALYSLLVGNDEYTSSPLSQSMLDYTIATIVPYWTCDVLRNYLFRLSSYTVETIKPESSLVIIKGSLDAFVLLIKQLSIPQSSDDLLELMNSLQSCFEAEGLSRVFSDTVKEKKGNLFYLKRK